jgi:hypothetical protein
MSAVPSCDAWQPLVMCRWQVCAVRDFTAATAVAMPTQVAPLVRPLLVPKLQARTHDPPPHPLCC